MGVNGSTNTDAQNPVQILSCVPNVGKISMLKNTDVLSTNSTAWVAAQNSVKLVEESSLRTVATSFILKLTTRTISCVISAIMPRIQGTTWSNIFKENMNKEK